MPDVLNEYTGDGTTTVFNFAMVGGYLDQAYVKFYTRPNAELLNYTPYPGPVTWTGAYSVQLATPVPIGTTFVITRETPVESLVDFQNTSRITEKNLDTANKQALNLVSEIKDELSRNHLVVVAAEDAAASAAASAADSADSAVGSAQQAADSAAAAATATVTVRHAVLSFPTRDDAEAAVEGMPPGQVVEVEADAIFSGRRTKNRLSEEGVILFEGFADARREGARTKVRDLSSKVLDLPHFRDWTGLTGQGDNDDTIDVQNMVDEVGESGVYRVRGHEGRFVVTSPIAIRKPITIVGVGNQCPPFSEVPQDPGAGTYFHIAHSGTGFDIWNSEGGVAFEDFGTFRTQPTPGSGTYTPEDHGFDFVTAGVSDTWFKNMMLLNASRAVRALNGGAGRLGIWNMRGQPLIEGIRIDSMYDVCRLHDVHFWPFWSQHQKVWDWMMANADAFLSYRNDNPFYTNIFSIFYRNGLVLGGNEFGVTNKLKVVNADFDRGQTAITVLPSAVGATATFTNMSSQGEGVVGLSNPGMDIGAPCELRFTNLDLRVFGANAVRVTAPGVDLSIDNFRADEWNQTSAGFPAVEVVAGSTVYIEGRHKITNGHGAPKYGGAGRVSVDEWRTWTPNIRPLTGSITTSSTTAAYAKYYHDQVHLKAEVAVANAGTGGTALLLDLPPFVPLSTMRAVGTGREMSTTGLLLQVVLDAGGTEMVTYNSNNAYPAPSGSDLAIDLVYPVINPS